MIAIAISLVLLALVGGFLIRRDCVNRQRNETPKERYRREMPNLQGGGIHPGGQPMNPPKPDNQGGTYT